MRCGLAAGGPAPSVVLGLDRLGAKHAPIGKRVHEADALCEKLRNLFVRSCNACFKRRIHQFRSMLFNALSSRAPAESGIFFALRHFASILSVGF